MRPFATIATNAFMELVRQPVFLLLTTVSAVFVVFLASIPYFGFGDDPKLVKESALAVMLLSGLLGAVLCASNAVAREIRTGTALAVLAKPVSRLEFLLAKYAGVTAALTVLSYVNGLAVLLASRMGYDAYGDTDWLALGLFCAALALAYAMGGFSNYFLRRPFVSDGVLSLVLMATLAFVVIGFLDKQGRWQSFGAGVDWRMVPAAVLVLFAVWVLAALALLCSTRLELIATLAVCTAFFLLGLMADYLFEGRAARGSWWATAAYAVVPNWQLMWVADALEEGKRIPWSYLGNACAYVAAYIGAVLAAALYLFEDRELN
ncbi:MAG: hypothetical protein JXQ71_03075 [Verrucomicrobia bacterium]|nr:hypothetical protein [Verrucomicrobiota bacterium]